MKRSRPQSGLTLIEVVVAIALLAVVLIPAMNALRDSAGYSDVHADITDAHFLLASRMEDLLAEPFTELADAAAGPSLPSSYSDPGGTPGRLLVYLSNYDGDNADADDDPFTGTDADLLWIRVELAGSVHALETLSAEGT